MPTIPPRIVTLVVCEPSGDVLGQTQPFVTASVDWRDTEEPCRWAREHLGVAVTILRLLDSAQPEPPGGPVTYLAEVADGIRVPSLVPWAGQLEDHPLRHDYAKPGGPARALQWAGSVLDAHGLALTGPAEQVRTWNLSAVWRLPIVGETLWLKCVPGIFAHEGAVISLLESASVPRLLGHEPGRILMHEVPGRDLHHAGEEIQLDLVSDLVALQASWSGRIRELLELGVPDWRSESLAGLIGSVVERTSAELSGEDHTWLSGFVDGLGERFDRVADCGVPDTLVHGDFWTGNARGPDHSRVLLDWGDCGVGHPLLDQSAFTDRIPPGCVAAVRTHWALEWSARVPGSDPVRAAELLEPVALARQAVVYQGFLDNIEPSEHPYHRGDPAVMLTRAAQVLRRQAGS